MGRGTKIAVAVFVGVVLGVVGYFAIAQPIKVLPRVQTAIPFEMSDQNGDVYRYPDSARPINMYIVAAGWDDAAIAQAVEAIEVVHEYLAAEGIEDLIQFAWITPDPVNDDIHTIRSISARVPIVQTTGASFLTGAPTAVRFAVGAGLGIFVGPPPEEGDRVFYEPALALVDDLGWVRGRYSLRDFNEHILLRDIGLLSAEVQAEGSERALYEAAHLFLCYPR